MKSKQFRKILNYILPALAVALTVFIFKTILIRATPATVALVFVVEVLFTATFAGFGPGFLVSLMAALCFNFFFLPPFGTFAIAHPADIVAFFVFLITAIVVSRLSSAVRQRAKEAEHKKDEVESLYKFAKVLIETPDTFEGAASIASRIIDIFNVEYAGIHIPDKSGQWKHVSLSSDDPSGIVLPEVGTLRADTIGEMVDEYGRGVQYTLMKTPARTIGVMALRAPSISKDTIAAIAGLVALTLERNRLISSPF